ncbi:tetratricopeptide repeat protein [Paracrocinitomix mangrovi]|uniref:tetratricopeptide repeat protein n=1 Tax=Paracrocinitomix mangrovi TaxID=2862509 RepID=UPI001C8EB0E1|nr:tetratricopeptide repeat protein [Paracrocinitomix mangrovi]UKN03403.1 tetratricopeptide repeat protein [Paracrocinitomix mangrovi]
MLKLDFKIIIGLIVFSLTIQSCGGEAEQDETITTEKDSLIVTDSLTYFQKKLNDDPANNNIRYARAKYYVDEGDIDLALEDLKEVLKRDSTYHKARKLYADINLSMLQLDTSQYHYKYLIRKDSLNPGPYLGMAKIHAALSNYADADVYISKSLQLDPYSPEPYFTRGLIYRSDYYSNNPYRKDRNESWDIAVSSFQTAIEQEPNYYAAYIELGVMFAEKGDSTALEYYNSALDIYPESIEAWYNKGYYYQSRGEVDNALDCFYTLKSIDSTWYKPYYNLGYIHLIMTDEYDSAIYYFQECTKWDPTNFEAYNNLGLSWEKKGDVLNAKKYYQKAIDINPNFQLAKDNLNALM